MRSLRCGCFFGALLVAIAIVVYVMATGWIGSAAFRTPPPATATAEADLARQFDEKVESFDQSAQTESTSLVLTEDELNAKLAELLWASAGGLAVKEPRVRLLDGAVRVEALVPVQGLEVPIQVELDLGVSPNGGVKVDVTDVDLGAAGMIPGARGLVEDAVRRMTDGGVIRFDQLEVEELTIESGRITLVGRSRVTSGGSR